MSGKALYSFVNRPLVKVRLENPHNPSSLPLEVLALVDTGADSSAIPASFCPFLGHSFENGLAESSVSGVGQGTIRSFVHTTKLTVLFSAKPNEIPQSFDTVEFPCNFIEQSMSFILLGQRDFLRLFRYAQDGQAGWFSLEQITAQ